MEAVPSTRCLLRSAHASVVPGGVRIEALSDGCASAVLRATVELRGTVVAKGEAVGPLELPMEVELWSPERPTTPRQGLLREVKSVGPSNHALEALGDRLI